LEQLLTFRSKLRQLSEILARRKLETEGVRREAGSNDEEAKQREYSATFLMRLRHFFAL